MKKSINFWKTSNSAVEIRTMECPHCERPFYELDGHELDDCPLCGEELHEEPEPLRYDSRTYTLIVDHKTGVPSVIRNDEYEPVVREAPPSQTE
ncbi:hypothetical protein [Paenibacillus graminis]|uniref:hypothetical protein n=1 Tax=Paenibacillus graminis TaxID=189425 RepID=UPI002DB5A8D5|nr:hypothetical protein [Paenibacillus graminis]MEC0171675.1 hypothetical protein [Paenibacillus graminis]